MMYYRHTGYAGGLKKNSFKDLERRWPERIVQAAVKGMLPRTRYRDEVMKKIIVHPGPTHPHIAQGLPQFQPQEFFDPNEHTGIYDLIRDKKGEIVYSSNG